MGLQALSGGLGLTGESTFEACIRQESDLDHQTPQPHSNLILAVIDRQARTNLRTPDSTRRTLLFGAYASLRINSHVNSRNLSSCGSLHVHVCANAQSFCSM